jgi:hypothetical protein
MALVKSRFVQIERRNVRVFLEQLVLNLSASCLDVCKPANRLLFALLCQLRMFLSVYQPFCQSDATTHCSAGRMYRGFLLNRLATTKSMGK